MLNQDELCKDSRRYFWTDEIRVNEISFFLLAAWRDIKLYLYNISKTHLFWGENGGGQQSPVARFANYEEIIFTLR